MRAALFAVFALLVVPPALAQSSSKLAPGAPATPALRELGIHTLGQALRLDRLEVESLGQSLLVCGELVYPPARAQAE